MNDELYEACKLGDLKHVKHLISLGCDPTANLNYAIQRASGNGHLEVVQYLAKIGCDPQADNNLAIRWASGNGHLKVVRYLAQIGCDPKARDDYAIYWASYYNHSKVVQYLLELGCDHKDIKKDIKYIALQDFKCRLSTFLNKKLYNKYLKMEILKMVFPIFTEWEIMSITKK